jgi:hypothetical protein
MTGMNQWSAFFFCLGLGFFQANASTAEWRSLADGDGGKLGVRFEGKQDGHYLLRRKVWEIV